jgi:hypothetical protein
MSNQLSLKELEQKAFRSTYQDGLWDIYFGLIVICMSVFIYHPKTGYSPLNIALALAAMAIAYSLFWAGKKFITLPRMGHVEFGAQRKKRKLTLLIILSVVVLIQVGLIGLQLLAWSNHDLGSRIARFIPDRDTMDLIIASVGALFVGPSMIMVAYFKDFQRGYYIAIMIALAVFLIIYLNQPIYPIVIGVLIATPGIFLLIKFLKRYPMRPKGNIHE